MPRLSSSLLRHARHLHPLLPSLLRPCRDLASARNELRWLLEHAISSSNEKHARHGSPQRLRQLVRQRGRGKPLQYILGSQPFGDLGILCRAGVLIPRSVAYVILPLHMAYAHQLGIDPRQNPLQLILPPFYPGRPTWTGNLPSASAS